MKCSHKGAPCGETCVCICDTCQAAFEVSWSTMTAAKDLCDGCGFLRPPYTFKDLKALEYTHFFMPCLDCAPAFTKMMAEEGRCATCRTILGADRRCPDCYCSKRAGEGPCLCRMCRPKPSKRSVRSSAAGGSAPPQAPLQPAAAPEEPPLPPSPIRSELPTPGSASSGGAPQPLPLSPPPLPSSPSCSESEQAS